ncbi:MAG: hypothetical protein R3B45_10885 [Bdellovibrionota bacterium]
MKILIGFLTSIIMMSAVSYADTPAVHGMLLFGDNSSYASHLPMFHAPHNYQLVMKINLQQYPRSNALVHYQKAKEEGKVLFTIVPEVLDLTQLANGEKISFSAAIYLGHFEKGGLMLGMVNVNVAKVIYFSVLDVNHGDARSSNYILFGESGEYFSLHKVENYPSFDAVYSIDQPFKFSYLGCGRGLCSDPIPLPIGDDQLPVQVLFSNLDTQVPAFGDILGLPNGIQSEVLQQIYIDHSDLSN